MQGFPAAQARYDAQEPPDPVECRFCDGGDLVTVVRVRGSYNGETDWPSEIDEPEVPCPYCLAGTPLRSTDDD